MKEKDSGSIHHADSVWNATLAKMLNLQIRKYFHDSKKQIIQNLMKDLLW